ncbi:MAG: hypothetical protein DVB22_002031, partial [Verrucomicrobia bacterium]
MSASAETHVVVCPRFVAPLDPGFQPAALWNRAVVASAEARGAVPLVIALEGEGGRVTRYESVMAAVPGEEDMRYAERLLKMLLWARGGWRVLVAGPAGVAEALAAAYAPGGARAFDAESMRKAYGKPLVIEGVALEAIPETRENVRPLGGHLDGCRIGFDLGASDFKLAAVEGGEVVWAHEIPWDPKNQADPDYHYQHLAEGLRTAASHLPRVDAIGGSSAGIIVDKQFMVASLLRSI